MKEKINRKFKYPLETVEKFYGIVNWYTAWILRMPRSARIVIGQPLQDTLIAAQNKIIEAGYEPYNVNNLEKFNVMLDQVRYLTRLSHDNGFLSARQVMYIGGELHVVGGMAGNWRKRIADLAK